MNLKLLVFVTILGVNSHVSQAADSKQKVLVWNPFFFHVTEIPENSDEAPIKPPMIMIKQLTFDPETMEKCKNAYSEGFAYSGGYKIKAGHEDKFKETFAPLPMTNASSLVAVTVGKMADEAKK